MSKINKRHIPTAMAAMFAAIPFIGTYWASLPAIVELWLIQERGIAAIAMATVSLLPTFTVTSTLLSDIKGFDLGLIYNYF